MRRHVSSKAYSNAMGEAGLQAFLAHAHNGGADHFLAFIEEELHPEITRRHRIDNSSVGLYGHSQGGLFTLYALTFGSRLFNIYGAASPGIMTDDSQVFSLYRKLRAEGTDPARNIRLHMTANDIEMTGTIELYRSIGNGFLKFIDVVRNEPLPGLHLTSTIICGETHFSGVFDAYRSFLRSSYASAPQP